MAAPAPKAVEVKIEPAPLDRAIGSSSDLLESMGIKSDAPLCICMSGACFVCEGYDMWRKDAYVRCMFRMRRSAEIHLVAAKS